MTAEKPKQTDQIRAWLMSGRPITPLDALNYFGCFRLGARVWDLKREGMAIEDEWYTTPGGARVKSYRLSESDPRYPTPRQQAMSFVQEMAQ